MELQEKQKDPWREKLRWSGPWPWQRRENGNTTIWRQAYIITTRNSLNSYGEDPQQEQGM